MTRRLSIAQVFLWLFVVVLGIAIGGGLYEQLVVMPLWSLTPPDSVLAYYQHNIAYPQFVLNQGGRFWIFFTPTLGLLTIATLVSGIKTQAVHRRWRIAATALALIVIVFTFAWFVPNIILLTGKGVTELSAEHITGLTNRWVRLNWVRALIYIAAWLAGLRALTIPSGRESEI
jgi:hypothetical protein